jgi:hypothetical protein
MPVEFNETVWYSKGYFWMIFGATWGGRVSICYAPLASSIRHSAAPVFPDTDSIDGESVGIGIIIGSLPRKRARVTLSGVVRGTTILY